MKKAFWLSFCDPARPKGQQFLGACIVEGDDIIQAVQMAHVKGCNPGGEVKGVQVVPATLRLIRDEWRNRLISRDECRAFDQEVTRLQKEAEVSPPEEVEAAVLCPEDNKGLNA